MQVTADIENTKDLGDLAERLRSTTAIKFAEALMKKPYASLSEEVTPAG